ncbi:MAG: universal stress protein [Phaeodactylibacter sp.]|nr:universal stress protein [Phaeodactylibacter sp.]MCB9302537.1 universal stress protein [Lewinellaceae bacterium]HQU57895.1 universal stress protein [Saprospiraceae bacterium]
MKSILVPTDFSACAYQATEAATQLARRFNARLHLLNCLDIPENWDALTSQEQAQWPEARQLIYNAQILLADLNRRYSDMDITTSCRGGKVAQEVARYTKNNGIGLVVMGSHGASGKSEYFIGSNTQKVVREVHCPVLVIKEPLSEVNFDKVVFASNFNESEREPFLHFKEILKHFMPEFHLVEIHTSSLLDPPYILSQEAMDEFRALCAPFSCKTHIHRNFSVERGIRAFAEEVGAKLIGISNHNRHPLKRMLAGSNVEALVNHSNIPVLSIDYEEAAETPE